MNPIDYHVATISSNEATIKNHQYGKLTLHFCQTEVWSLFTLVCNLIRITQELTRVIWIWFMWLWPLKMPSLTNSYFQFSLILKFFDEERRTGSVFLRVLPEPLLRMDFKQDYLPWRQGRAPLMTDLAGPLCGYPRKGTAAWAIRSWLLLIFQSQLVSTNIAEWPPLESEYRRFRATKGSFTQILD